MTHRHRPFSSAAAAALVTLAACGSDSTSGPPPAPGAAVLQGAISASRTLSSDTTYTLRGFVQVQPGATLTIQAGTKIVGDTTVPGSSLFILKGAQINAVGTATNPIVFTSARAPGNRKPGDWGGLILVGNGVINRAASTIVEGSDASVPGSTSGGIAYGGGTNNNDNSGTLRYVRVEFAGYAVAQDAELNSFTFAAIGRGTTVDHLQSILGLDDSYEWFGGAVDSKYLVSYESGDDHFDAAEGFVGRNQFLIALQTIVPTPLAGTGNPSVDPQGFEIDGCNGTGCASGQASTPFTVPIFANWTLVGPGPGVFSSTTSGGFAAVIRRGTGGNYINGISARWPARFLSLRDSSSVNRFLADSGSIQNVSVLEGTAFEPVGTNFGQSTQPFLTSIDSLGTSASAAFTSLPALGTAPTVATLDWSPSPTAPTSILSGGLATLPPRIAARAGTFLTGTNYRGAAAPAGEKWWSGWTVYFRN